MAAGTPMTAGLLVLERSNDKREYIVSDRLLEHLRDRRVPPGFRILPQTVSVTHRWTGATKCAGILERLPGDRNERDYHVAQALLLRNLRRDIVNAAAKGYRALGIWGSASGYCAVLERESDAARAPLSLRYALIAAQATSTIERELNEAATRGYRLHSGSAGREFVFLMERGDSTAPPADYLRLSTTETSRSRNSRFPAEVLEGGMNSAAARGYHLHPFSLASRVIQGLDEDDESVTEIVAIMERRASRALEYRVMGVLEKDINTANEQGWELVATLGSRAVMRRPVESR